jgi:UDP-N-acetylmuramyl pentapeptide phosphotransferase/UDP-N-acetylglucosamine-1-phosphate transferase
LGFLAGALGLWGWQAGVWPAWFPLLVFSVFGVDATVTLLRRARRGEKVWLAHREHYYQRLIQSGWSHRQLALAAYLLMFLSSGSACLLLAAPRIVQALFLLAWGIGYLLLLRSIDWRLSRSSATR